MRRTMADLGRDATVDADGTLRVSGQEVSVVYYRAGYSPEQHD